MSEQRFVVEITRPVPPEKVATVAERIAVRLRLDLERIHTLLDGRVGPVTRPVLADKADSIAEVFAEAGVRVIVVGAPNIVTATPAGPEPAAPEPLTAEPPRTETPTAEMPGHGTPGHGTPAHGTPAHGTPGHSTLAPETSAPETAVPSPESEAAEVTSPEPGDPEPIDPEPTNSKATDAASTWDAPTAWGYVASDIDQWQGAQRARETAEIDESAAGTGTDQDDIDQSSHVSETAGTTQEPPPREHAVTPRVEVTRDPRDGSADQPGARQSDVAPADPSDEDEADRLGPASSRTMPERLFTTSTRWVPSPHDAYGFDNDEEPYVPAEDADGQAADEPQQDYLQPGGYPAPEFLGDYPRRAPALRTYLLWSLAASLVVLILLQVVFAARGSASPDHLDYDLGLRTYQQGDFAGAKRIWEPLASEGEPRAQYQLGFMAQHGLGQPWSNARAANYYRRAAEAGIPEAQLALGDLYLRGMGVEQDAQIGAQLYRRAAEGGNAEAQYQYAQLLMHGEGVAQQFNEALSWLEAAAAGGIARAADMVAFAKNVSSSMPH